VTSIVFPWYSCFNVWVILCKSPEFRLMFYSILYQEYTIVIFWFLVGSSNQSCKLIVCNCPVCPAKYPASMHLDYGNLCKEVVHQQPNNSLLKRRIQFNIFMFKFVLEQSSMQSHINNQKLILMCFTTISIAIYCNAH